MRKKENIKRKNKIYIVIGTRAQLIKMAPIMVELQSRGADYEFVWTGQHKETIKEIIDKFGIKEPDKYLYKGSEIKSPFKGFLWLAWITLVAMFSGVAHRDKGVALIHGDASSALIGLIYGKFKGLKIGHVEAGYRSYHFFRPFPEEIIRVIVSYLADYHFVAGKLATDNLKNRKGKIIDIGVNTLYDALNLAAVRDKKRGKNEKYAVVNVHRFECIQNKKNLEMIVKIISEVSKRIKIIFVLHPSTEYQLKKFNLIKPLSTSNIKLIPRQDYMTYIDLVVNSEFIMTDSGGNQQETSYLGHPCLIMRTETEGREGLGRNAVVSEMKEDKIYNFVSNYQNYNKGPLRVQESPSKIIVDLLETL